MKSKIFTLLLFCLSLSLGVSAIVINTSGAWYETAYTEWSKVVNADSYNVYYSGKDKVDQKIDDQLIRTYSDHIRADIPGLEAGDYTLKIVAIVDSIEAESAITPTISVTAHDRTGFAFSNAITPGAYTTEGLLKDQTVVLYISENTKNTISMDITGANANPCVGLETILEGLKKGRDSRPFAIRFIGQITDLSYMDKGDIVVENKNNTSSFITLEGIGEDATIDGFGIRVKNASNIEIRNLGIMNTDSNEGDNIGLQQGNDHIWVHNCDFFYGGAGGDADQVKGDGALDCKKSNYVTFSYNHFWDNGKSNLLGLSEGTTEDLFITYHHNWYDHSDSRHPRVRYYSAHVYNNYYDGNSKYGIGSTLGSSVYVESNYFRNCKYPMLTSMQGSDVYNSSTGTNNYSDNPTFSKEDGGNIKAFNNTMVGQQRFVAYGDPAFTNPSSIVDFDAYVATTRNEQVPAMVVSSRGGHAYNNFDTNTALMYTYSADTPEEAKTKVIQNAGRLNQGDFQWTFNNASDDASSNVNTGLKKALISYSTTLISIQGEDSLNNNDGSDTEDDNTDDSDMVISGDIDHNFTTSDKTSEFFTIIGNLSDSKGTVSYDEQTLSQCLKLESSTQISFSLERQATLTLVFNSDYAKKIKVDGTAYSASSGLVQITLAKGSHSITKADVANLFYISILFVTLNEDINENINENIEYLTYPNPAKDQISISGNSTIETIKIYDLTGKCVMVNHNPIETINLAHLKQGNYILQIFTQKGRINKRIRKK
ncbi:MAG: T9SS type A sorting domain-containing protein [Bacteroidales bacterium]|jgi:pectate lyase|nr:T9SS type A sorting domain-containing protein [Bacteroidales bacterium]